MSNHLTFTLRLKTCNTIIYHARKQLESYAHSMHPPNRCSQHRIDILLEAIRLSLPVCHRCRKPISLGSEVTRTLGYRNHSKYYHDACWQEMLH